MLSDALTTSRDVFVLGDANKIYAKHIFTIRTYNDKVHTTEKN